MNHNEEVPADVGVIVGRFQVADLHDGHRELIERVIARHKRVLIIVGRGEAINTWNNPLDWETRKQMICSAYPSVSVLYINDAPTDEAWSADLDRAISVIAGPVQSVLIYGSRDSFIPHYTGKHHTYQLKASGDYSGTNIRAEIAREVVDSVDFRRGLIYAARNRYPVAYCTADIAIFDETYSNILLGQKEFETGWRMIGGFSDPRFETGVDQDAIREAEEETGMTIRPGSLAFIGSYYIEDRRYAGEPDCIKTQFYAGIGEGAPVAADDIKAVKWFPIKALNPAEQPIMMPNHRKLGERAYQYACKIGVL